MRDALPKALPQHALYPYTPTQTARKKAFPATYNAVHNSMSRARSLGTSAETAVVKYLRDHGFIHAERRALRGSNDCGDVTGIPGVVIEVKNHRALTLGEWIDQTETERDNAEADLAVCWHKRRGHGSPAEWYVTMTGSQFVALLKEHTGLANWPLNETMKGTK